MHYFLGGLQNLDMASSYGTREAGCLSSYQYESHLITSSKDIPLISPYVHGPGVVGWGVGVGGGNFVHISFLNEKAEKLCFERVNTEW